MDHPTVATRGQTIDQSAEALKAPIFVRIRSAGLEGISYLQLLRFLREQHGETAGQNSRAPAVLNRAIELLEAGDSPVFRKGGGDEALYRITAWEGVENRNPSGDELAKIARQLVDAAGVEGLTYKDMEQQLRAMFSVDLGMKPRTAAVSLGRDANYVKVDGVDDRWYNRQHAPDQGDVTQPPADKTNGQRNEALLLRIARQFALHRIELAGSGGTTFNAVVAFGCEDGQLTAMCTSTDEVRAILGKAGSLLVDAGLVVRVEGGEGVPTRWYTRAIYEEHIAPGLQRALVVQDQRAAEDARQLPMQVLAELRSIIVFGEDGQPRQIVIPAGARLTLIIS